MPSLNIASTLQDRARAQPDVVALKLPQDRGRDGVWRYHSLTYRELDTLSDEFARRLVDEGIGPGVRTVLMVPPSLEFFVMTFALFKAGAVAVFVDPGMGIANIGKCLAEAEPAAFVGIPKAHLARVLFGWGAKTLRHWIAVGRGAICCRMLGRQMITWSIASVKPGPRVAASVTPSPADAPEAAAILFTSGSTGVPKGAVYSHENFLAQIKMLRDAFQIEPGEIDLCTFPLFGLFAPALGMTAIVPRMDFTRPAAVVPAEISGPVQQHHVTNVFGSPALLNRVGRHYDGTAVAWPSLRRVLSAGAPVSAAILERLARRLRPDVQIYTPYGATEALPVAVIGSHEVLQDTCEITARGGGTCVGRPVAGLDVTIIRITDEPIAQWSDELTLLPGQIGEIVVSGPNVTQEYFRRPDLTALAKIPDARLGRARHRMGDVGYFDDRGRLWFCGRKSHRVILEDVTLFTEPVEGVFNTHPQVFRTALVGVTRGGRRIPVLCVEREAAHRGHTESLTRELRELGQKFEHTRRIESILYHDEFPVDIRHNSKIFREKLAVWAEEQLRKAT